MRVLVLPLLAAALLSKPGPPAPAPLGPAATQATAARAARLPPLQWIYSEEGRQLTRVPEYTWLNDGTVLLYDLRRPLAERPLERLEPLSGRRQALMDLVRALASLKTVAPALKEPGLPGPPDAIDPSGARVFYVRDGDVLSLDLATATFRRLTNDPVVEKNLTVSPDGRRLAFVRGHDLVTLDLDSGIETALTRDGSDTILNGTLSWVYWEEIFGRHDSAYWWSPDSRSIAYLQTDQSAVPVSHFVDFAPVTQRLIAQRYPKAGMTNPRVRVGIVSASGGESRWVQIADKPFEYVMRVGWSPDARLVTVQTLTRDQHELGLYFVDASSGAARRVVTETDPGWVNSTDDLRFLKHGTEFLWASERTGYRHLYRYRIDGTLVNAVTSGDWSLATADQGVSWLTRSVTGVDERTGTVYFVSRRASPRERHLERVQLDGAGLRRVSASAGVHSVAMSPDARFYFDTYSNARTPPALSLHRADGTRVAEVAPPLREPLAGYDLAVPEFATIPAADGFSMPARILRRPHGSSAARHPVVMHVYGGPSAPLVLDEWDQTTLFHQHLVDAGFAVVQVDNRAATGISKRLENTILRRSGTPETADLADAARWLKQQPWVDPARLGVWGWSGGGTMTLNLLTRSREFAAGIAVAPVTDWRFYDTKWTEAYMKRPEDNPDGYAEFDLVARAPSLHGRLLLVYGTYDDNVHPQNSEAFADALVKAGIPFDMQVYPMRKHGISDLPAQLHLYTTMLEFWRRWLGERRP